MVNDGLVQWVKSINIANLINLPKDKLEDRFGKDFALMKGYSQNNPHHCYDLLEHTIKTAEALDCYGLNEIEAQELMIAALFHDIGKPYVAFEKNGRTVFYNHAVKSKEIAEQELSKQNLGECSLDRILFYIENHDAFISFKLKSAVKGNKLPYVLPITLESVYRKIIDTQGLCTKQGRYVPTVYDYILLMRLCIADVKAQSLEVFQDGKLIDSLEQKLARLNAIESHIRVIYTAETEHCDFHTHSVYSDGMDTPGELVSKAFASGLRAVALTDHNTIDGLDEFIRSARNYQIDAVPGIEFSTEYGSHELHVIGLFIDKAFYKKVNQYLSKARKAKEESNRNLIKNLRKDGYEVSYKELELFATSSNINRAVIGQYLLSKGIISSVEEGFKTILSKKSGYYIPPQRPSTLDTIRFIKSIGAVAVLAHPLLDLSQNELEDLLPLAKKSGIDAIEANYSLFSIEQRTYLQKLADEYGILVSGGSDYHGTTKPNISLGIGKGNLSVSVSIYLKLLRKLQR